MQRNILQQKADELGAVPLTWVAATSIQSYVNLGDALSPVMVSLLSGKPVVHVGHRSNAVRMAAVGTIGQNLVEGDVSVWGTGVSRYSNPLAGPDEQKQLFVPHPETRYRVYATRGPVSRALLGEGNAVGAPVFGDPVWMLPRFYRPNLEKKWDLGVIVHLSDLENRSLDARPKAQHVRYDVPAEFSGSVRIINTITGISPDAMRQRLDDILSCRRIVSTSLHGMVFAESYGIPCLYFSPRGKPQGLINRQLDPDDGYDLRITDLYQGLGRTRIPVYVQSRRQPTDWANLMQCIDNAWEPVDFDCGPLEAVFPLDVAPLEAPSGGTVFDHPIIRGIPYQHTLKRARDLRPAVRV